MHVRLQAILASLVMPRIVPSRIALARRGSLWALATLLAVLASARLLRRYGRLSHIEFSIAGTGSQPLQVLDPFLNNQGAHGGTPGGVLDSDKKAPYG